MESGLSFSKASGCRPRDTRKDFRRFSNLGELNLPSKVVLDITERKTETLRDLKGWKISLERAKYAIIHSWTVICKRPSMMAINLDRPCQLGTAKL